ncbi:MAG: hypothetical protein PHQ96_03405 [Candidatus Omnitrophica bacterium]|nr:hypothetical protein [Candidatus Omnitrophota bacterium]
MKINKILIASVIVLIIFVDSNLLWGETGIYEYAGERILYLISPLGKSEYRDLGMVDLKGIKVNLVIFRTKILFFDDTEKIYSDLDTLLPLKIERTVSKFLIKEHITEEYDQKKFTITQRKFKGNKIIYEHITKVNGPIHNGITLPFYMRMAEGLEIGWHCTVRIPDEYRIELVSIDEIKIPAGKFQAYHFKSTPDKFELWINKNTPRIPLKIQGKRLFNYALVMKKYGIRNK